MTQVEELQAEIDGLKDQLRKSNRSNTDKLYMISAMIPMLGPKGRQVIETWQCAGIQRIHFDWATNPMNMQGEDVAQLYLEWDEAAKNAKPITQEDLERF